MHAVPFDRPKRARRIEGAVYPAQPADDSADAVAMLIRLGLIVVAVGLVPAGMRFMPVVH